MRLFTDPRCLAHRSPPGFPEQPRRLTAILDHLSAAGYGVEGPSAATVEAARAAATVVHPVSYVERFERAVARGDALFDSADNPLSPGTADAAWGAVAAALAAADAAAAGEPAFAAVRPPGHHAERATAMGFCWLNNAAIAAEHLRRHHELARVAIFDFDVHHGNGTQHHFEERADVFYASTHQFPFYPGTGAAGERGVDSGEGATLNVPLAAGGGDEEYRRAFDEVLPALEAFAPHALVLSAGFDAWRGDPLGGMRVSEEGFAEWGRRCGELARRVSGGRVMALLEGGYDVDALPRLVAGCLAGIDEGMSGDAGGRRG